jgi:hypothetical protein
MTGNDTTADALAYRTVLYRRMSTNRRTEIAAELSEATRATTLANIRRRHPSYSDREAQMALFRLLLGDALFVRAYPSAPRLAP